MQTVLIVEDTESVASTLQIALTTAMNVLVLTARNGSEAWQLLSDGQNQISALVTDLHMPEMDGFELIERIRSYAAHAALPIIVITGCTDPKTPERLQKMGANAFFAKPYSPAQLREKLEQLLHATQT